MFSRCWQGTLRKGRLAYYSGKDDDAAMGAAKGDAVIVLTLGLRCGGRG